jgi:acyl-CoA thioester hydrolase
MKKSTVRIRVRYVETDQMGVVHHANYFAWMETARTELIREAGISYRELESRGVLLPVREAYCRYRKSLKYDDAALIEAELLELGGASIRIGYRVYLDTGDAREPPVAEGYTLHPFMDARGRVIRAPKFFTDLFTAPPGK